MLLREVFAFKCLNVSHTKGKADNEFKQGVLGRSHDTKRYLFINILTI